MMHLMFRHVRPGGRIVWAINGSQTSLNACQTQDAGVNETLKSIELEGHLFQCITNLQDVICVT